MKTLTCPAARRRLHAYHDAELPVSDQIAVSDHLDWCEACASAFEELQSLRVVLRSAMRERKSSIEDNEDDPRFRESIVSRLKAEDSVSFTSRIHGMFEDMRLVYAGLGASVAAIACVLMMLNMMRFVKEDQRPDSLAAIMSTLASSEASQANVSQVVMPVMVEAQLLMVPRLTGASFAADSDADVELDGADAEFALAGVITREGSVDGLQLMHASSGQPVAPGTEEARALQKWMSAVAKTRYEPARLDGLPVPANKYWLVAHTTVHGSKTLDRPVSVAAKKRITSITDVWAPRPA